MATFEAATAAPPIYRYDDLQRLMGLMTGDEKHSFAATSTLDVLWVLYDRVLRVSPDTLGDADRDRFMLSKGHGPMAFYAVLAARGFIPVEWLETFGRYDSPLGYHPDRNLVPGVEISSGSLGHGLALACGAALALRAQRRHTPRFFCLLGDAEMDEGSVAEAIVLAGRERIDSLTAIVVDNSSSSRGWPGGIAARYELEGWDAATVDGRDHAALEAALTREHPGRPLVVVAVVEAK
jgi:transketolase